MKSSIYAVRVGRKVGIFNSWAECEAQVKGHPGSKYRKTLTEREAMDFIGTPSISSDSSSSSSSSSRVHNVNSYVDRFGSRGYGNSQPEPTPTYPSSSGDGYGGVRLTLIAINLPLLIHHRHLQVHIQLKL